MTDKFSPLKGKQNDAKQKYVKYGSNNDDSNPSRSPNGSGTALKLFKQKITDREEFLKSEIAACLAQLLDSDRVSENLETLDRLKALITTSTGFSSIPDTLKILLAHYETFRKLFEKKIDARVKESIANIVSFVATSHPPDSEGHVLKYYLLGSRSHVNVWGIAYVRDLSKDIVNKWKDKSMTHDIKKILFQLIQDCSVFYINQNSELEACDFLIETEQMNLLDSLIVIEEICSKVCNYITACATYLPDPEDKNILYSVINLWLKYKHYVEALFTAIKLQDLSIIEKIFHLCQDVTMQKQMALILARHNLTINADTLKPEVSELLFNSQLNKHFTLVARQLDVMAPKAPNDIIKNKSTKRFKSADLQSSVMGSSFLNCFINAAFSSDKLVLAENGLSWICKHKEISRISATASLGIICLWDIDGGLNKIDKFLYSNDTYIKAGALLAVGIVNCTVKSEFDPAYLLLQDYISNPSDAIQLGSIVGLAMAYVGTNHTEAIGKILDVVKQEKSNSYTVAIGAISCGLIASSSANGLVISNLIEVLAKQNLELNNKPTRNLVQSIGLCVLGKRDLLPNLLKAIKTIKSNNVRQYLKICIEMCAYVGSSNILKIQELIKVCSIVEMKKAASKKAKKNPKQKNARNNAKSEEESEISNENLIKMIAVIGIGMISVGDDVNSEMIMRTFGHFLRFGDSSMKNAVILAVALIYLSNPKLNVIELLSKYSHSYDLSVAMNAIFALGFVSAGTNNAKVSKLLHDLTNFYSNKQNCLFAVKISQGLLHLGKGTLTLSPLMDGKLIRNASISGILIVLLQMFDPNTIVKENYYLFFLACAIRPKMMITLDSNMNQISVPVRVGQFVDTIGQAGKPRSITGFQTFSTPVLIGNNEKAELATDEYVPYSTMLEGCVILKRNIKIENSGQ